MEEYPAQEPGRGGWLGWVAGTLAVCALFWGALYLLSLQSLGEELARHQRALAELERRIPTARAEPELARVERRLRELKARWEAAPAYELGERLAPHGVELLRARPGDEAAAFLLEVEGSVPALAEALPGLSRQPRGNRLPAVLYIRRISRDKTRRGLFTLEGAGRLSDWSVEPPAQGAEP